MGKRASPGVGHNGDGPSPEAMNLSLAVEILDQEAMAEIRERRKRHRATSEGRGVQLNMLDMVFKRKDDSPQDIEKMFREMWGHFSAYFSDLGQQYDLFTPKPAAPQLQAAYRHQGLMAALKGEDAAPPPLLVGDDLQKWQDGFNEGAAARKNAKKTIADELAEALRLAKAGRVVDATGGTVKDGGAATPPPPGTPTIAGDGKKHGQPDWTAFPESPIDFTPEQSRIFRTWYDGLPKGAQVVVEHPGVKEAFKAASGADFEAPAAELEKQQGRGARRDATPKGDA